MLATEYLQSTVPCLEEGPIAESAQAFIQEANALGQSRRAGFIRAWTVAHVFARSEAIFASYGDPVPAFNLMLVEAVDAMRLFRNAGYLELGPERSALESVEDGDVEQVTGRHYGGLFAGFSKDSFWREAQELLRVRLERNGLEPARFEGCSAIDVGCGGGRYACAWRALGAEPVHGVDISPTNIQGAAKRAAEGGLDNIEFQISDVLQLDIPDSSYDVVFSNGVLHHTSDWKKGVSELVRILRPGGFGWLYLIENPGGLFWDSIELLRIMMQRENRENARRALEALHLPGNRIFYMLDHVMAPINLRLTAGEIESALDDCGAVDIRRLNRGADFDRVEQIYRGRPHAETIYGVGENRFVFSKN